MKKIVLLSALFISFLTFAQVPQGISYQAIALNSSGTPVVSSTVGIQLSVLDDSATGTVLYTETHIKTTNAQGLFNLVIGQGTPTFSTFSALKWESNSKFLKVEMDAAGGINYVLVGTTQLLSVPYALYAGKVDDSNIVGMPDVTYTYISEFFTSSYMTSTNAYVFAPSINYTTTITPTAYSWQSTAISGTPFMKSKNSFLTSTYAYVFGPADGTDGSPNSWHSFSISGQPIKISTVRFDSQTLVLTSTNAYLYAPNSSGVYTWSSSPTFSGSIVDVTKTDGYIGVLTTTNAYLYGPNATNNSTVWSSISISGTPLKIKNSIANGLIILTSTNSYFYGLDNTYDVNDPNAIISYSWHNIPYSGTLMLD